MNNASFVPPQAVTEAAWGVLRVEKKKYKPLEEVQLTISAPVSGAETYRLEWYDGLGNLYGRAEGKLVDGKGQCNFQAGGFPGMHYVRLFFDDAETHSRLVNFYLKAETEFTTGNSALDAIYPLTREAMLLNRRRYPLPEGEVVGYTTADSLQTLAYWLRDMFYNEGGFLLFERDVKSGYEALFSRQHPDGTFPDGVRADGSTWRMISESDVEYIAVLATWTTWMVTGDDAWLKRNLPRVERGFQTLISDPLRWDKKVGMVRRAHTCDTWDFSIYEGDVFNEQTPAVAATCDQSGVYLAMLCLADMHEHLGNAEKAEEYRKDAHVFRERVISYLWDGEKFQHHLHLAPFDHGDFLEQDQLAMGNTWAMVRGLADTAMSRKIIATYRQRQAQTGAKYPWWSLEPGYPQEMGEFLMSDAHMQTGGYCNGGLMPWVGGCLAQAALENGEEEYGAKLLLDYAEFFQKAGGELYTWYWQNGDPGFRTTNTTGHDGWAMGHWMQALWQGLAGVQLLKPALDVVKIAPRWQAAGCTQAQVIFHLPSSDRYIAYRWKKVEREIQLQLTGVSRSYQLQLLVPQKENLQLFVDGRAAAFETKEVGESIYLEAELAGTGIRQIQVVW